MGVEPKVANTESQTAIGGAIVEPAAGRPGAHPFDDGAVTLALSNELADKGFLERFRREARAVGRFNTQHVVQIHDVGFDQGLHYIIMERVRGGNLRAFASAQPGGCLSV